MGSKNMAGGEYWTVVEGDGGKNICLVASAAHVKPGSFMLKHVLSDFNEHQIYINCESNQWYLDGVPGLGDDYYKTALALGPIIDTLKTDGCKTIFVGSSMGGYAAVMLGALLNVDYVFATGVEFILGMPGGLSKGLLGARSPDFDIFEVMKNSDTKFILGCGENCATDLFCLAEAKRRIPENVSGFSMRNRNHSLPPYLQARYGYQNLINQVLNAGFLTFKEKLGTMLENYDLCKSLQFVNEARVNESLDVGLEIEKLHDQLGGLTCSDSLGYAYHALSCLYQLSDDRKKAVNYSEMSLEVVSDNYKFYNHHARLLVREKQFVRAVGFVEDSLELQNSEYAEKDNSTRILYARSLKLSGRLKEAVYHLQHWQETDPNIQQEKLLIEFQGLR